MIKIVKALLISIIVLAISFSPDHLLGSSPGVQSPALAITPNIRIKDFNRVSYLIEQNQYSEALLLFKETFNSWRKTFNKCDDFVPEGNHNFYPVPQWVKVYDSVFTEIYNASISLSESITDKNTLSEFLFYCGRSKYYIRDFRDAYSYFEKSLEYANSVGQKNKLLILNTYEATGDVFEEIRKYQIALSYYDICENLTKTQIGEYNQRIARIYEKKGGCFAHLNDEKEVSAHWGNKMIMASIKFLRKARLVNRKINDSISATVNTFQLGLLYHYLGNFSKIQSYQDSAKTNALKAIKYLEKYDPGNLKLGNCYNVMKGYYIHSKLHYDSALYYTKCAYNRHLKNRGKHHPMTIMAAANLAGLYRNYNYNIDSALFYIQKAIAFSFPAYSSGALYSFPDVGYTVDFEMGFAALNSKAEILIRYGIDNRDQNAIDQAFELIDKTEKYLSDNNNPTFGVGYFNEFNSSYYHTLKTASNCYMICDSVFPERGYREKAFANLEKMKYLQFIANMNDEKLKAEVGIPERYIVAEREMNNRIIELKNRFINRFLAEKYHDINTTLKIQKEFLTLNDSLHKIRQLYKSHFPGYYQLLNNVNTISLSKLQSSIDEQTAIIDYFFSRTNGLYAYVILHNRTMLFNTPVSSYFRFQTDTLQQLIIAGGYSADDTVLYNKFVSKSRYLYNKLFPPELTGFISGINKLIILPEKSLYSLSFDVLLATNPGQGYCNYKNLDYLIKKYSISILYSAFMLLNNQDEVTGQEYSYQGYAPEFNDTQLALLDMKDISPFPGTRSYGELTANRNEVEEAGLFFANSKLFLNDDAGEYKYKTYAPKSEILHLATHAQANVLNPLSSKLIFSLQDGEDFGEDNILNLYEIYQTPINAKLVVLSACESNKGNLYNSEGLISLSRAFINAGAKSVVSTHWWAHDETTRDVMVHFFKGVKNELPIDQALRNSKLNFLKNTDSRFAHPYYWANFVLIGNTNPFINNSGWSNVLLFALIGVVILVMGFLWVRRFSFNR